MKIRMICENYFSFHLIAVLLSDKKKEGLYLKFFKHVLFTFFFFNPIFGGKLWITMGKIKAREKSPMGMKVPIALLPELIYLSSLFHIKIILDVIHSAKQNTEHPLSHT